MDGVEGHGAQRTASISDQTLRSHLRPIRDTGWITPQGTAVLNHFEELCDAAVRRWRANAGGLGREGISLPCEHVSELLATGQDVEQFPKYIQAHVRRIYTGYAAAAQTGLGNPMRRGLAAVAKRSHPLSGPAVTTPALTPGIALPFSPTSGPRSGYFLEAIA